MNWYYWLDKVGITGVRSQNKVLLAQHGAHHPKDVDKLFLNRAERSRNLIGMEDCDSIKIYN